MDDLVGLCGQSGRVGGRQPQPRAGDIGLDDPEPRPRLVADPEPIQKPLDPGLGRSPVPGAREEGDPKALVEERRRQVAPEEAGASGQKDA